MKKLTLVHTGVTRDQIQLSSYKLGLTVSSADGISKEVFVKQRLRTPDNATTTDIFVAVATPAQLEDLPPSTPAPESSYFRDYTIELISENPEYLDWVLENVLSEVQKLVDDSEVLNNPTIVNIYNIESGEPIITQGVDEVPASGSKTVSITSPTNSENVILFFTNVPLTISKIVAFTSGTSPSVHWTLYHGANPSIIGTEVINGGTTTTSENIITNFNNAHIADDSFVWFKTTAIGGVVEQFSVTIFYN